VNWNAYCAVLEYQVVTLTKMHNQNIGLICRKMVKTGSLPIFRVQGHSLDHYIDKDQNNVYNILVHQKLSRKTTLTTSYAKP